MQSQAYETAVAEEEPRVHQITFHFVNGQTETFNVYNATELGTSTQELRQDVRRFLREDWWTLHLLDQTVFIHSSNVLKVEIKPRLGGFQGEGVFQDAERVTAFNRYR
ncbi:hypothetical protein [Trichothermofontia sp.]